MKLRRPRHQRATAISTQPRWPRGWLLRNGVDVKGLQGSGPRGRVTKDDVEAAISGNGASAAAAAPAGSKPIRGPAATLARFMNESRSIPTATSFRTVEVDTLDGRRKQLKGAGKKLSFTHLIAWAIVQAAKDMPVMTNAYAEVDGKPQRVIPEGVSLGLAVDVERKDGTRSLVVPVLKQADGLDFPSFAASYDELVVGARDNTLKPDAYAGANISLTNPGGIGTVASVPRLMPGQGTIVATGAISVPPGLKNVDPAKLRELGVGKVMTMTSTYDHRVIQGAESGQFLRRIDELLQGEDGFYESIFGELGVQADVPAADADGAGPVTAAEPAPSATTPGISGQADLALLQAVQAATSVVKAHRMHGHLAARLDPLGSAPESDPALNPATVNLTPELMQAIPASVLRVAVPGDSFADALPHLQETYCGTVAYEIEHISDHEQRVWLRQSIESGEYRQPLPAEEKLALLQRLTQVDALETYLHKAFLGKKQFSIEGLDMLLPMLDETIELASQAGAREVVIGMAHRGRLNVLAHTVGRSYGSVLVEFEGESNLEADTAMPEGGTGDVKYHHGAAGTRTTKSGKGVTVSLSPNPSHLEFVDPVVEGRARADQSSRKRRELSHDPTIVLPVLVHGDAAFPGQGIVAETLNLQALEGYTTGGTIHLITNNQIGFTTEPSESRSTRYASDLAKGFDVPIIHVNADDVEGSIAAVRLAMAFRDRFGRDVVIDLIGYRRFGHNEQDEPAYTQPQMYEKIKKHPPVRKLYSDQLIEERVISRSESNRMAAEATEKVAKSHERLKASIAQGDDTDDRELDRSPSPGAAHRRVRGDAARAERAAPDRARQLQPAPQAEAAARAASQGARGGHDRLGAGRGAGVGFAAPAERPDPAHRPGHRARHVLAAPPEVPRLRDRRPLHADAEAAEGGGAVRAAQLAAVRAGGARLRVRLQRAGSRDARDLGGAVRRLRERRPGDRRPVHGVRARQVGPDHAPHAAAAARLRGRGPGALLGPARALPAAGRRGQHPRRQLHDARAVLPPAAAPGADHEAPPARGDDAEEPAAPARRHLEARPSHRRALQPCARRPVAVGPARRGHAARALQWQGLLRHHRPRGAPGGGARGGRPRRAALPVRRERAARADGELPAARDGRLGPGGAEEHGRPPDDGAAPGLDPAGPREVRVRRQAATRLPGRGLLSGPPRGAAADRSRRPGVVD